MDKQNETEKFSRIIIIKMTVHGMIQELQDSDDTFDNIFAKQQTYNFIFRITI